MKYIQEFKQYLNDVCQSKSVSDIDMDWIFSMTFQDVDELQYFIDIVDDILFELKIERDEIQDSLNLLQYKQSAIDVYKNQKRGM